MADYWCKMSAVLGLPREALEFVRQVEAALDGDGDVPADLTAGERELLDACGRSRADFSWDEDDRAIWVHGDDVDPEWVAGVVRVAIRRFGLTPQAEPLRLLTTTGSRPPRRASSARSTAG